MTAAAEGGAEGGAEAPLLSLTTPLEGADDLSGWLRWFPGAGVAWLRGGEGFVGWGQAARIPAGTGPERFARSAAALKELFGSATVGNEVGGWGTGPLAVGSFTFDDDAPGSELVIPALLIGRMGGRSFLTRTGRGVLPGIPNWLMPPSGGAVAPAGSPEPGANAEAVLPGIPRGTLPGLPERLVPGSGGASHPARSPEPGETPPSEQASLDETSFLRAVGVARQVIGRGGLDKVVLSLQQAVHPAPGTTFDLPGVVANLAGAYPSCYTFAFESFVGASPELLVRRQGTAVRSMPLAGSTRRGATAEEDAALGAALLASAKDRWEHDLAVLTVVEALHPLCRKVRLDSEPFLLALANVAHLATSVEADLSCDASALEVAGALHPTAAVCGSPTRKALALIRQLEGIGRGRYAGPVGWVDAAGDGEWAIALRCAEVSPSSARLYAGCGIVRASEPAAELEEARLKLRPIRSALGMEARS